MYMHHMCAWYPGMTEEGIGSPRAVIKMVMSHHECWGGQTKSSDRAAIINKALAPTTNSFQNIFYLSYCIVF